MGRGNGRKKKSDGLAPVGVKAVRAAKVTRTTEQLRLLEKKLAGSGAGDIPNLRLPLSSLIVINVEVVSELIRLWELFMGWPLEEGSQLDVAKSYVAEFAATFKAFVVTCQNFLSIASQMPDQIKPLTFAAVQYVLHDGRRRFLIKLSKAVSVIQRKANSEEELARIDIGGSDAYSYYFQQFADLNRLFFTVSDCFKSIKPDAVEDIEKSYRLILHVFQLYVAQLYNKQIGLSFGQSRPYNQLETKSDILNGIWRHYFVRWCAVIAKSDSQSCDFLRAENALAFLRSHIKPPENETELKLWNEMYKRAEDYCKRICGERFGAASAVADKARDEIIARCRQEIQQLKGRARKAERLAGFEVDFVKGGVSDDDDEVEGPIVKPPVYEPSAAERFYDELAHSDKTPADKRSDILRFLADHADLEEREHVFLDAYHAKLLLSLGEALTFEAVTAELARLNQWEKSYFLPWIECEIDALKQKQQALLPAAPARQICPTQNMIQIDLPNTSRLVLQALNQASKWSRAYIVGGFLRDKIWQLEPKDCDIVIYGVHVNLFCSELYRNQLLQALALQFKCETSEVKIQLTRLPRLLKVILPGREVFEIWCSDSSNLRQDATKRDFTLNAMGCDATGRLHFYGSAYEDCLEKHLMRCNPATFFDDPVRALRAVDHLVLKGCWAGEAFLNELSQFFSGLDRSFALRAITPSCYDRRREVNSRYGDPRGDQDSPLGKPHRVVDFSLSAKVLLDLCAASKGHFTARLRVLLMQALQEDYQAHGLGNSSERLKMVVGMIGERLVRRLLPREEDGAWVLEYLRRSSSSSVAANPHVLMPAEDGQRTPLVDAGDGVECKR